MLSRPGFAILFTYFQFINFCFLDTDFHCQRLDDNKLWSQKLGSAAATDKDGAGKEITDPRKAVNLPFGPDYNFVSFMKIFTNIIE